MYEFSGYMTQARIGASASYYTGPLSTCARVLRPLGMLSKLRLAGDYQSDERAGVARLSWRVSGR